MTALTLLPSAAPGFTSRSVDDTIALLPPGRHDLHFFYDTLPMPLLRWMRSVGGRLPSHDQFGHALAWYSARLLVDGPGLYTFDRARQDFVAEIMDGDVYCAACANDLIDESTDQDDTYGLFWSTLDISEHTCDLCHINLEDQ